MIDRSDTRKHTIPNWTEFPLMNHSLGTTLFNHTGSWRYLRPHYQNRMPPCNEACPAGNDIEGWLFMLGQNDPVGAWRHLLRENPFPGVCGRVCFHFCTGACNRKDLDGPVGINHIERYLADTAAAAGEAPEPCDPPPLGRSVAVVGAGPAGLAFAWFARRLGFSVTVFEALPKPGGILRYGIPAYRLPREVIEREIAGIVASGGIEIRCGVTIGVDIPFDRLRADFDHLFLAPGVHRSLAAGMEGEDHPSVRPGLAFLKDLELGRLERPGRQVVVVGGGNTAIDVARTARRLGSEVTVLYRRTRTEMPAHAEEVAEAESEGVAFRFLAVPDRVIAGEDGRLTGVECGEMTLGEPDESGRRRPVRRPGASFRLPADLIVTAIGERADLDFVDSGLVGKWGTLAVDPVSLVSPDGTVRAGGDAIDQPHTVVHAIGAGKRAAIALHCAVTGRDFTAVERAIGSGGKGSLSFSRYVGLTDFQSHLPEDNARVVGYQELNRSYFHGRDPSAETSLPPGIAAGSFAEAKGGFDPETARREAERCFHCGQCTMCDNCRIFCPDVAISRRGDAFGYRIDYDYCKGCGVCVNECPRGAMRMERESSGG